MNDNDGCCSLIFLAIIIFQLSIIIPLLQKILEKIN
jgi:hypothetical protein